MQPSTALEPITSFKQIRGWFSELDLHIFDHFLGPGSIPATGDLVELGVYMGKSAAVMGRYVRPGETFTVCDLFGGTVDDPANHGENQRSYSTLDRQAFEHNYLALFDELPTVVEGPSSSIVDHVPAGTVRFLHVDASHLYEHVRVDIESARQLLLPEGIVSFDDYRSLHTPGVAAAVWAAVVHAGLHPVCVAPRKLYATFGDSAPHIARMKAAFAGHETVWHEVIPLIDGPVVRVRERKPVPAPTAAPPTAAPPPPVQAFVRRARRRIARSIAGPYSTVRPVTAPPPPVRST